MAFDAQTTFLLFITQLKLTSSCVSEELEKDKGLKLWAL